MSPVLFKVWSKHANKFKSGAIYDDIELQWEDGAYSLFKPNYEFFKYAGFKDINGKMVFEGDIVKYIHWYGDDNESDEMIGEVKFGEGDFYPSPTAFNCEDSFYSYGCCNFEIIGNIKENPELPK